MTTEKFGPLNELVSRTTLTWGGDTRAVVDMDKGSVTLTPMQRNTRKRKNRAAKAGRRAAR